jgi:hypothetical protein
MKKKYFCPHCKAQLNLGSDIIFTVNTSKKHAGLILVSPQIGDYSVTKDTLFPIEKGEHLDILCPVCHHKLQVGNINSNLAMIMMRDERGVESEIYFSEIFGEHCTYKITNKNVEMYGDDSHKYNFWGITPNYY